MQLSQEQKSFSKFFFFAFSKYTFNFEHLQKEDDPHCWVIFQLADSEKLG